MEGELEESICQIIMQEEGGNNRDIKFKIMGIKSLNLNIGHSTSIELWPTIYTWSERFYVVGVPSIIEDTIMPAVIEDKLSSFKIDTKDLYKLFIEEKSMLIS